MNRRFSVATCNVQWASDGGLSASLEGLVHRLDADVTFLQEVWRPFGADEVLHGLARLEQVTVIHEPLTDRALLGGHRIAKRAESGEGSWGLAAVCRLPVVAATSWALRRAWRDPVPRVALELEVLVGARPVKVLGTHLSQRLPSNVLQLRELLGIADEVGVDVIVGDLNTPGVVVRRLLGRFRSGVRAATWPASHPLVQLDHVAVSNRVGVVGAQIIRTHADHLALRLELEV